MDVTGRSFRGTPGRTEYPTSPPNFNRTIYSINPGFVFSSTQALFVSDHPSPQNASQWKLDFHPLGRQRIFPASIPIQWDRYRTSRLFRCELQGSGAGTATCRAENTLYAA